MDTEILKTLQSIEKLLKSTTTLSSNRALPGAAGNATSVARAAAESARKAKKDSLDANKTNSLANESLKNLSKTAKRVADSIKDSADDITAAADNISQSFESAIDSIDDLIDATVELSDELADAMPTFKAVASAQKSLSETTYGLSGSMSILNTEVIKTRSSFAAFSNQLASIKSQETVDTVAPGPLNADIIKNTKAVSNLGGQIASILNAKSSDTTQTVNVNAPETSNLDKGFNALLASNNTLANSFAKATSLLEKIADCACDKVEVKAEKQNEGNTLQQMFSGLFGLKSAPVDKKSEIKASKQVANSAQSSAESLDHVTRQSGLLKFGLAMLGEQSMKLLEVLKRVGTDFMQLARVGMGTSGSLWTVYKNALLSGMGLKDYLRIIKENNAAAARSGNLEQFNQLISGADSQLASLGVFGSEARELQAILANSNVMMGVSFDKISGTISSQVSVFEKLRKTTNMTAEEFGQLVKSLAENEQAQRELNSLTPFERSARQAQLVQMTTMGQRMGLTAEAAGKLKDAILAARGSSAESRFEQAGRIRQLGSVVGMGAEAQRYAQLELKGAARTAPEEEERIKLLGKITQQTDIRRREAQQQGNLGFEYQLDELEKTLAGSATGQGMTAARTATLQQESKAVSPEQANADFGQNVSEFGKAVGQFASIFKGVMESPIPLISSAIGAGLLAAFTKGPILKLLSLPFRGGPSGGAVSGGASAAAKAGTMATGFFQGAVNIAGTATKTIMDFGAKSMSGLVATGEYARKFFNSLKLSSALVGPLETLRLLITGVGPKIGSAIGGVSSIFGKLTETFVSAGSKLRGVGNVISSIVGSIPGLSKLSAVLPMLKSLPLIGTLISAGVELFTQEFTTALNPSGGFWNGVGGIITASLAAIPQFFIDGLKFFFGDALIQPIQNGFDIFVSFMNFAAKTLLAKLVGGIAAVVNNVPFLKDSKFAKLLNDTRDGLTASAEENNVVVKKLSEDQNKTLKTISAENKASAIKTEKETKDAAKKVQESSAAFNNVVYGSLPDAASLVKDAKQLAGTVENKTAVTAPQNKTNVIDTPVVEKQVLQDPIKLDPAKVLQDPVKVLQDPIKLDPVKVLQDPIKLDPVKVLQDPVKVLQDPIKLDPVKVLQDPIKLDPVKVLQDPIKLDPTKNVFKATKQDPAFSDMAILHQPSTSVQESRNASANIVSATPEVQQPKFIVPNNVNTPETESSNVSYKETESNNQELSTPETISLLQSILNTLNQSLLTEQEQSKLTSALLNQSRPRADFTPSSQFADRILGPRTL